MLQSRRIVAALATLTVLVAVPATASAKSSNHPASAGVQTHVVKAQKAVKRMKRAAKAGNSAVVISQLRTARSQTAAASRKARGLAAGSDSVAAARALTLAGTSYDQLIASITALVDDVTGQAQALLAQAINPSIAGKQQVLGVLTSLLGDVPATIQPILASIIAGLGISTGDDIAAMDAAVGGGTLPVDVSAILTQSIGIATSTINSAFAMIKSIVPMLPAAVQGPMTQILDTVLQTVGTIIPTVLNTVTGLIGTVLSSLPIVGSAGAGGLTSIFGGLLGGVTGGGQSVLPGNIGGMLSNLLGGLLGGGSGAGSTPAAGGIGGIVGTVTGLIGNLLGGLFGGQHTAASAA